MSDTKQSGHVLDRLMQYCDGQLAPSDAAAVKAHVETCNECAAELGEAESFAAMWREIGVSALLESLPSPAGDHVEEADLWYLADPGAPPIPDEFREKMRHVLGCRRCYVALRERRGEILQSASDPDLADRADEAWDRLRAIQLKLLLTYVAVRSGRVGAGRLRIGLGGPRHMRMLSEIAQAGSEPVEREIGSPWEFDKEFGDYSFRVVITPRDFGLQTLEVRLQVTRLPEHSTAADLRAELSTVDAPGIILPFVDGHVVFGAVPLRNFQIIISDTARGSAIGFIEITNQPS